MSDDRSELFRQMLRIRRFEERCVELYSGGRIRGFLHLYIGEEAVATGVVSRLGADDAQRELLAGEIVHVRLAPDDAAAAESVSGGGGVTT